MSFDKVGDVQEAQGDLAGALKSYNDSLVIRVRLAKSDPGNAGWQRAIVFDIPCGECSRSRTTNCRQLFRSLYLS